MKDIHPTYHKNAEIKCACGNVLKVGSTQEEIEVEICSNCHPFYTGKKQLVDTAGRAEKFEERRKQAQKSTAGKETEKESGSKDGETEDKQSKESEVIKQAKEKLNS